MLFNSLDFLIFFPTVVLLHFLLPQRWRWAMLLGASCYFYMAFVPAYIVILFATIVIDYFAGLWIENAQGARRKRLLVLSLVSNLGILAFFKYLGFFTENIADLLKAIDLPYPAALTTAAANKVFVGVLTLFGQSSVSSYTEAMSILPIGLSFHTFQAMSYTIEVYRGNQPAERHFGIYALYVMFFPQLVAGPIERPQNVLHQFHEKKTFDATRALDGLRWIYWGLFKKMVIADRLSQFVDPVFNDPNPEKYGALATAAATVAFAIQ
ncbi:MAG: MBOAT family protein, partial [Sphingobacteriaceae bacterium]|nr:MBOAT family protein [Cytophagaceae bacterium]